MARHLREIFGSCILLIQRPLLAGWNRVALVLLTVACRLWPNRGPRLGHVFARLQLREVISNLLQCLGGLVLRLGRLGQFAGLVFGIGCLRGFVERLVHCCRRFLNHCDTRVGISRTLQLVFVQEI